MSKLSMIGNGNYSDIFNQIHMGVLDTESSCELVDYVFNSSESLCRLM